jgi:hypothetical protein
MRMPAMTIAMLSCASVLSAQTAEYDKLTADYERAAKGGPDQAVATFLPQFQAAAGQRAGKEAAVPFLMWIVRNGRAGVEAGKALDTLAEAHGTSLELGPVLDIAPNLASYFGEAPCATLIDKVLAAGSPPELQARALLARATMVAMQTGDVEEDAMKAAVRDLEQARKLTKDAALKAAIERAAAGPRGLKIGEVAPEVAGFDLDGVPFRLSDYRGKVVVLDFWGDW